MATRSSASFGRRAKFAAPRQPGKVTTHKGVTIIGVSSSERRGLPDVEPFVTKQGDKMFKSSEDRIRIW